MYKMPRIPELVVGDLQYREGKSGTEDRQCVFKVNCTLLDVSEAGSKLEYLRVKASQSINIKQIQKPQTRKNSESCEAMEADEKDWHTVL